MTLKEWYKIYGSDTERLTRILDKLDVAMKKCHERGLYVLNFDPKNISVNFPNEDSDEEIVSFPITSACPAGLEEKCRIQNIYMLAALDIGLYTGFIDNLLNIGVIRDNFERCASLLPEDRRDYYRHVIVYEKPEYQFDFFAARQEGNADSNSKSLGLVKSTPYGKLYANQDTRGRVNTLGLSTFIVAILLIIVIIYIILLL